MKTLLALAVLVVVGGCAEVVQGPRFVPYTEERFYIRHAPLVDGSGRVDDIAQQLCGMRDQSATLISEEQYYFFDLRDATYQCVRVVTAPPPRAPASG
jgi:hypothetical protein